MTNERLERYRPLYNSARRMGSARILREYLDLPSDFVVPLSIAHGVDMNHTSTAMDVDAHEPLHWSYNALIHERARLRKPSVRLPHPWLMLRDLHGTGLTGSGVLVIGPPPGRSNDLSLHEQLGIEGFSSFDILLKYRGDAERSREFWESRNVSVKSAGVQDEDFYDRLYRLLQEYEYVVGCTLSSALFYAAAIGKKCLVLENYRCSAYETPDYLTRADFSSPTGRNFLKLLRDRRHAEATAMAADVLGSEFLRDPKDMARELEQAITSLAGPIHHSGNTAWLLQKAAEALALATGKTGLIRLSPRGLITRNLRKQVCVMYINEIDVWLSGLNADNFQLKKVPYVKGVTEPGWAVD